MAINSPCWRCEHKDFSLMDAGVATPAEPSLTPGNLLPVKKKKKKIGSVHPAISCFIAVGLNWIVCATWQQLSSFIFDYLFNCRIKKKHARNGLDFKALEIKETCLQSWNFTSRRKRRMRRGVCARSSGKAVRLLCAARARWLMFLLTAFVVALRLIGRKQTDSVRGGSLDD